MGGAYSTGNNGKGTFTEVGREAGVTAPGFTTSAVWFDYDNDGLLDLFVCGFVDYSPGQRRLCGEEYERRYCVPRVLNPSPCHLFRNRGDGTFEDATEASGVARRLGKSLGVVAADIDNDGLMDLFETRTIRNRISSSTTWAMAASRSRRSSAADFDGDGWQDLVVANIDHEGFALYRNLGRGTFEEESLRHDIGRATYFLSGWGLKFFDFDNDGTLDLIIANGHPDDRISTDRAQVKYAKPLVLFRQQEGRFHNIGAMAGPAFSRDLAARGLALGDFNNDGKVDVLVGVNGGAPVLLRNEAGSGNHWLGLKLMGARANRDAVGARISWRCGGVTRSISKSGGGSFLSSHDPGGLGSRP